jgi:hypothetical protein
VASRRWLGEDALVPERPEAIRRLDLILEASRIAHEATFDLRRDLGDSEEADELLRTSAHTVPVELVEITARARELAAVWGDQRVFDPQGADATLAELEAELSRIETQVEAAIERQRGVAGELSRLLRETE